MYLRHSIHSAEGMGGARARTEVTSVTRRGPCPRKAATSSHGVGRTTDACTFVCVDHPTRVASYPFPRRHYMCRQDTQRAEALFGPVVALAMWHRVIGRVHYTQRWPGRSRVPSRFCRMTRHPLFHSCWNENEAMPPHTKRLVRGRACRILHASKSIRKICSTTVARGTRYAFLLGRRLKGGEGNKTYCLLC